MTSDPADDPLNNFEQAVLGRLRAAHARRSGRATVVGRSLEFPGDSGSSSRPRRRTWLRRMLVATAIALMSSSGALAAITALGGSSSPPVRVYGGKSLCPAGYGVAGQVSTKLFYPANYPGHTLLAGDVMCFDSASHARRAGFRLAPAPAGDTTVGPIYLGHTDAEVTRTCEKATHETKAIVYCPTRLPTPWIHPLINWDCPTANCNVPVLSLSGSFAAPRSDTASGAEDGQLTFWSASEVQIRMFRYVLFRCGTSPRLLGDAHFRGHRAAWYRCSIFGSMSTVLKWHIGKEVYEISASGASRLSRELVRYVAAHLVVEHR